MAAIIGVQGGRTMDPDAAYALLRDALGDALELLDALASGAPRDGECEAALADLASAVDALDGWLRSGGFLPAAWRAGR